MSKKMIAIVIAVAAALVAVAAIIYCVGKKPKAEEYPRIVYIDNYTYYVTDKKCDMVPRKMPDGVIDTFIESEIMPDMMNSANFGAEYGSMEYMFLEDGQLILHMGEDWYFCEMPQ